MLGAFQLLRQIIWGTGLAMHIITIPGTFFHELAHQLACYLVGHRVLAVKYLELNDPVFAGYVLHEGKPGVARHLIIGSAPLLMGLGIWSSALTLGWYLLRDGDLSRWQAGILIAVAWATAAATYHCVPSPLDMENVFRQPFSMLSIPCYLIAAPIWLLAQNYRVHIWGWTLWRVAVVLGTGYVVFLLATRGFPPFAIQLPT